jgi:hypothetical protein
MRTVEEKFLMILMAAAMQRAQMIYQILLFLALVSWNGKLPKIAFSPKIFITSSKCHAHTK